MKVLEKDIKKAIVEFLEYHPQCEVFPTLTGGMYNPKTGAYRPTMTKAGTPDLLCCFKGKFLAIEIKRPKGKLTTPQQQALQKIENAGGLALVARSIEDVKNYLRDFDQKT